MDAAPASDADAVLRRAIDGEGAIVEVDDAADLERIIDGARGLGFTVLDVVGGTDQDFLALGPLWCALDAVVPVLDIPPVSALAAPPHVISWMHGEFDRRLDALTQHAPVVVATHPDAQLDDLTADALDALMATAARPVVWARGHWRATPPAHTLRAGQSRAADSLLVRLLAVSDAALVRTDLAELTGMDDSTLDDALDGLRRLEVIAECRGNVVLRSAELRGTALDGLPTPVRRALRRGAFDVLRRRGVSAIALAEMARDAAIIEDRAAVEVLTDTMYALRDSDPGSAARYGVAAIALLEGPSDLLTALAWQLLPLLWQTGDAEAARALALRVFSERGRPDAEAQTLLWVARFEGDSVRALEHTTGALSLGGISDSVRARLLGVHLRLLSTLGRRLEVDRLLPAALIDADAAGEFEALSRLQTCDAIRAFYLGDYERSRELTALADRSWERSGADLAERMPEMIWGPHVRLQLGDPDGALAAIDALLTTFEGRRQTFAARFLHSERSLALLTRGQLADASDEAVLGTTASEREWSLAAGASDRLQAIALSVRLKVALHVGDAGELDDIRTLLARTSTPIGSEAASRVAWWLFLLDDAQGTAAEGTRSVNPATLSPVSWLDPSDEVLLCRALLAHGYHAGAEALVDASAWRAAEHPHPLARTIADHLEGLVTASPDALDRAVAGWARLRRPLIASVATWDLGLSLIEDRPDAALDALQHAHAELQSLGAHRDAWRIRWYLRAQGHAVRGDRSSEDDALTPAERRVVDRAVRGSTVGRIAEELSLSPHTVTTHLRHVYTKLGIGSRAELIAWSIADGTGPTGEIPIQSSP